MNIEILPPSYSNEKSFSDFVISYVKAGYPSPAQDFEEEKLDLNRFIIKHPLSTFLIRVSGNSMKDAGIEDGDILVVDRSLEPRNGDIALCVLNGEFTVKRIKITPENEIYLIPENPDYSEIKIKETDDFQIWGVITYIIHRTR